MDSKLVECRKEGEWIAFNVTSAVKYWTNDKSKNHGLWLSVRGYEVPLDDFHVAAGGRQDPFLVEFGIDREKLQKARGEEKGTENKVEGVKLRKESLVEATREGGSKRSHPFCKLHTWRLKLYLYWQRIIAPQIFISKYCKGECDYPSNHWLNATDHSMIRSREHYANRAIPAACCVPTKLRSISVMYFTKDYSVVIEDRKMIPTSCGCL